MICSQCSRQLATTAPYLGAPALLELVQAVGRGLGAGVPADLLHVPGHRAAVLVAAPAERVPHQMHDAGLDLPLGECAADGLREALEAVDHGDQAIADAAGLELVHHFQPEARALVLLDPQARDLLRAVHADPRAGIDGLVAHGALVADAHPQGIRLVPRPLQLLPLPRPAASCLS